MKMKDVHGNETHYVHGEFSFPIRLRLSRKWE